MKNVVIFGPWIGEFSYELSWWNPEIRKIKNEKCKDYHAVHIGFRGRAAMYKDFIDEYIPIPKEIEDTLKYPALNGEHIKDVGEVIPEEVYNFFEEVMNKYTEDYHDIYHYPSDSMPIGERTNQEEPFGEYVNYEINQDMYDEIDKKIKNHFSNDKPVIALMARIRNRDRGENTKGCYLNWNPESWEVFLDRVINELDVNIVVISISKREASGGSLSFEDTDLYKNNKKNIMIMNFDDDDDSLDKQLALLKCTIKTPTFTQQTVEEGFRLKYKWERDLTDDLKNIKVFDKYHSGEDLYNSPPDELFEEFKKFYKDLK